MMRRFLAAVRTWAVFIVCAASVYALNTQWEHLVGNAASPAVRRLTSAASWYQQVVTAGPRSTIPRNTTIVRITQGIEPADVSFTNACNQRLFLARLIAALVDSSPSVIALDKYFGFGCSPDAAETGALRAAMLDARQRAIPVVVGRLFRPDHRTLEPSASLDVGNDGPRQGIVNLHEDTRRLSMRWPFRDERGRTASMPTFAVAAATAHRPDLLESSRLSSLNTADAYPYVSFLTQEQFAPYDLSALAVLCGPHPPSPDWRQCTADRSLRDRLRARIVIIGEDTPTLDQHATILGRMPGVFLQANYVEALLDERVFQPAPWLADLLLGLALFVGVELLISAFDGHPLRAAAAIAALVMVMVVVSFAAVLLAGRYVNPWSVSVLAIAVKFAGHLAKPRAPRSKAAVAAGTALLIVVVALGGEARLAAQRRGDPPPDPPIGDPGGTPGKSGQIAGPPPPEVADAARPPLRDEIVDSDVTFATGSYTLDAKAKKTLDEWADRLRRTPQLKVRLEGHADSSGTSAANLALAERRADAVRQYLYVTGKVPLDRLLTLSYGEERPGADNNTGRGRAANRRVEMTIVVPELPAR